MKVPGVSLTRNVLTVDGDPVVKLMFHASRLSVGGIGGMKATVIGRHARVDGDGATNFTDVMQRDKPEGRK